MSDIVVAGLGNPGKQYQGTRHNVGFEIIDRLAENLSKGLGSWRDQGGAESLTVTFESKKIILVKPLTYMNRSGEPLRAILSFYKIPVEKLLVIHDELDLPFGTVRLKIGGGEAGHNGLKSISEQLATQNYQRLRIGIGRPVDARIETADWVLAKFNPEERQILPEIISRAVEKILGAIK